MTTRDTHVRNLADGDALDVLVVGAGATGAPIYHELARQGYRTALVDRGDFACGSSQASGMMVWGGLLYLSSFDIVTVRKLCRARDQLIRAFPDAVAPRSFRFLPTRGGEYPSWIVLAGLYLYWLLGASARRFPRVEADFPERPLMKPDRFLSALGYEEGFLRASDCRFVLDWLLSCQGDDCMALNYCEVAGGEYVASERSWRVALRDRIAGREVAVRAKHVINCAGIWTDDVNRLLAIDSPYRHFLSKGVYLNLDLPRAEEASLIVETGRNNDVLTCVAWGPVVMWGPTETDAVDPEAALRPSVEDIRFLLRAANANLRTTVGPEHIVSVRCGVRPLGVRKGFDKKVYSLKLSRRYLVADDGAKNALAIYGGKLTSSALLAREVAARICATTKPLHAPATLRPVRPESAARPLAGFPHVAPTWSRDHERCLTLEDYLRRRTNISQWVPRMGLGRGSEHREALAEIAAVFNPDAATAGRSLQDYTDEVAANHDALLASV